MSNPSRFGAVLRTSLKGRHLEGHASVFGQVADIGPHYEQIGPNAFRSALSSPDADVRALFNHDPNLLLARQSSGTLKLGVDSEGLLFRLELPNTTAGNDVLELAERGDLNGASFAFVPGTVERSMFNGKRMLTHTEVRMLIDVSPVTFPAYTEASVTLRSRGLYDLTESKRSQLIRARARLTGNKGDSK